ncbi:MAG: nucleoside diphosphate kinase regulator [Opitutaceae bacterium]|nr:nucleoside diphosphate kinase regulator [Opitutaceae bacterium]
MKTNTTSLPTLRITASDRQRLRELVSSVIQSQPRLRETLQPLQVELERAEIMERWNIPATTVVMGSRVEIEDVENGEVDAYTLVYPEYADIASGKLSILAPIGTAIIGFSQGDTFTWKTPGGPRQIRLRKVEAPAEA